MDASQEMLALGLCNIAASFVQSMPITGSFSRTAVNRWAVIGGDQARYSPLIGGQRERGADGAGRAVHGGAGAALPRLPHALHRLHTQGELWLAESRRAEL